MSIFNTVFWMIITPIVTFGSELWVLRPDETELLRKFQWFIGRRCQRFHSRSPNYSSVYPLGWMSIDRFIQVKKLLFLRTMMAMYDDATCKQILISRSNEYQNDPVRCFRNEHNSPVYEILNICKEFGFLDLCMGMVAGGCHFSNEVWRNKVWEIA